MKYIVLMLSFIAALTVAPAVSASEKWDLPTAYAASNYHSETAVEFGRCITTGTGGDIEVVVHPSGSLFRGADIKRAVQTGQVPIGERLLSGHQNENPLFGIDSVPFLATSFAAAENLWQAARPALEHILERQNLVLLYSVPWPPQGLYFKQEVNTVADMRGLKFRSYNNSTSRFAELTAMLPVTIEAAEVSQAFATGVADSMLTSASTGYDRRVWESLSHYYQVDAWLPRNYVMVNKGVWDNLDRARQDVVRACAGLAEYAGRWRAVEYNRLTLDGLREGGMTVAPPNDTLRNELQAIGETMTTEWLQDAGAEGRAVVDAFKSLPP